MIQAITGCSWFKQLIPQQSCNKYQKIDFGIDNCRLYNGNQQKKKKQLWKQTKFDVEQKMENPHYQKICNKLEPWQQEIKISS